MPSLSQNEAKKLPPTETQLLVPFCLQVRPRLAPDGTCTGLEARGLAWSLVDRKSGYQLGQVNEVQLDPAAGIAEFAAAVQKLEGSLEGRSGLLVSYGAGCLRQSLHPVTAVSKLELSSLFDQYLDLSKELGELAATSCCASVEFEGSCSDCRATSVAAAASKVLSARRRSDEIAKSIIRQFVRPTASASIGMSGGGGGCGSVESCQPVCSKSPNLWEAMQQVEQILEELGESSSDPSQKRSSTSEPERACQQESPLLVADQSLNQESDDDDDDNNNNNNRDDGDAETANPNNQSRLIDNTGEDHCSRCSFNCQPNAEAVDASKSDGQLPVLTSAHRDRRHEQAAGDNGQPARLVAAIGRLLERLIREDHQFGCIEQIKRRVQVGLCEQSAKHHLEHKVVRARGLPWQATEQDIADFFAGLNIAKGGVGLCLSRQGRRNGEALVLFESREQRDLALSRHKHFMGARYIEVYRASGDDFLGVAAAYNNKAQAFLSKGAQVIIRMRGLPFSCTAKQVVEFFAAEPEVNACHVLGAEDGVLFVRNHEDKPTGDAFVLFASETDSVKALARHKHNIGTRYVELFRSTISEVQQVLSISTTQPTSGDIVQSDSKLSDPPLGQRSSRSKSPRVASSGSPSKPTTILNSPTANRTTKQVVLRSYAQAAQPPSSKAPDSFSTTKSNRNANSAGSNSRPSSEAEETVANSAAARPTSSSNTGDLSGSTQEELGVGPTLIEAANSPTGAVVFGAAGEPPSAATYGPAIPHAQFGYAPAQPFGSAGHPAFFATPPTGLNPYEMAGPPNPVDPAATSRRDCVRLRGLPFEAHVEDVLMFLGDYSKHIVYQGIHMVLGPQGQPSGEAIVQMAYTQAAQSAARLFHRKVMSVGKKQRYIEVIPCSIDDVLFGTTRHHHHNHNGNHNNSSSNNTNNNNSHHNDHQAGHMLAQYGPRYYPARSMIQHQHPFQMYHHQPQTVIPAMVSPASLSSAVSTASSRSPPVASSSETATITTTNTNTNGTGVQSDTSPPSESSDQSDQVLTQSGSEESTSSSQSNLNHSQSQSVQQNTVAINSQSQEQHQHLHHHHHLQQQQQQVLAATSLMPAAYYPTILYYYNPHPPPHHHHNYQQAQMLPYHA